MKKVVKTSTGDMSKDRLEGWFLANCLPLVQCDCKKMRLALCKSCKEKIRNSALGLRLCWIPSDEEEKVTFVALTELDGAPL